MATARVELDEFGLGNSPSQIQHKLILGGYPGSKAKRQEREFTLRGDKSKEERHPTALTRSGLCSRQ